MATEYQLTLSDYLSIIRRRAPYLIGIFSVGLIISIIAAIIIPPTYRATGTIIVESQQLPENVIPSVIRNKLDDQINTIIQRMMTRENLLQLANKHNLFNHSASSISSSDLIKIMRQRIFIETDNSNDSLRTTRQGQQAIAFTLSFEDRHPEVAFQVTKELISIFLDLNSKLRTEEASEATTFLTQESDKLKVELDKLEQSIAQYKQQHKNALPEQLSLRMTMLSRAENDLREVERDSRTIKEEIRTLEIELAAAKRGMGLEENPTQSLPALKAELTRLSSIYKESHPDIRRIKRKIDAMESTTAPASNISDSADISSLATYKIQARIDSDKARLNSLSQQREMLQSKISENESAMIQTPKVGQGLEVLIRDRDIAQKKFEEFRSKRMNAKIAENLESENKSGNFSLLEPPVFPEKPFKPNRIKILLIGIFLSIFSAGGAMMLLETIDKRIRGIDALTHVLGYRPLAVIPYITTRADAIRRKRFITLSVKAAIVAVIIIAIFAALVYFKIITR